jgi:hypothetical protein
MIFTTFLLYYFFARRAQLIPQVRYGRDLPRYSQHMVWQSIREMDSFNHYYS